MSVQTEGQTNGRTTYDSISAFCDTFTARDKKAVLVTFGIKQSAVYIRIYHTVQCIYAI